MDAKSTALLGVLSKCNPEDDDLKRESQIQHILHSEECQTLINWGPFIKQFPGLLKEGDLRLRSNKDLSDLSAAFLNSKRNLREKRILLLVSYSQKRRPLYGGA